MVKAINKYLTVVHPILKIEYSLQDRKIFLTKLIIPDSLDQDDFEEEFLTIVFENISIEILSLLLIIEQHYSFIKLKRLEPLRINNDLESFYQLNTSTNQKKL